MSMSTGAVLICDGSSCTQLLQAGRVRMTTTTTNCCHSICRSEFRGLDRSGLFAMACMQNCFDIKWVWQHVDADDKVAIAGYNAPHWAHPASHTASNHHRGALLAWGWLQQQPWACLVREQGCCWGCLVLLLHSSLPRRTFVEPRTCMSVGHEFRSHSCWL